MQKKDDWIIEYDVPQKNRMGIKTLLPICPRGKEFIKGSTVNLELGEIMMRELGLQKVILICNETSPIKAYNLSIMQKKKPKQMNKKPVKKVSKKK